MELSLALLQVLAENFFFYVIAFLFALLSLVALHEYGHFLVARLCGVRVDQFAIGFGKELLGYTDKHGIRWSLCLWPLGGYVKIFGDYDVTNPRMWDPAIQQVRPLTPDELTVAFCTKTVWQRMAIVLAGPMINFIPALFLLTLIFTFYGQSSNPPIITGIDINAAGYEAGFRLDDKIIEFEGKPIRRLEDVHDRTFKEFNKTHTYKILRNGTQELILKMKPREEIYIDTKGVERSNGRTGMAFFGAEAFKDITSVDGIDTKKNPDKARALIKDRLGKVIKVGTHFRQDLESIYLMRFPTAFNSHLNDPANDNYDKVYVVDKDYQHLVRLGFIEGLSRTFKNIIVLPLELYKRVAASIAGKNDEQIVAGVAKISDSAAKSAKEGIYGYIIFLCIFSIQLTIINLFPIPVLDGGYMVFLILEAIFRRPVPQKIQNYAFIVGIVLLMGIMIFANVSDILRILR